jgi:hypothetical protein
MIQSEKTLELFADRKLVIATKHHKEKVIAPLLESHLAVSCIVSKNVDTDLLGTFTGEVDRKLDPVSTAKKKCEWAMQETQTTMAIASEGSFGNHPTLFLIPANEEILYFIDQKNDIEIIAKELSTETNYNAQEIENEPALMEFASKIGFPSHALILRSSKDNFENIEKGINKEELLLDVFHKILKKSKSVYVETDMRALYNPTRMKVIEKATHKLIKKIMSCCPQCNTPGFDVEKIKAGLPCMNCLMPTQSALAHLYRCKKCAYEYQELYPFQKEYEEPMYCNFCNP